jgi:organic hydroperoxide reductase OsmC/OhrA
MSESQTFELSLEQLDNYEFRVRFDDTPIPDLITDETVPLGADAGPNPGRMLVAAIANCLAASLLFALRKFKNEPGTLRARARATLARNADRRWRVSRVEVDLHLAEEAGSLEHLDRILGQFEDFCIVTQSVRDGLEVDVRVHDAGGKPLH